MNNVWWGLLWVVTTVASGPVSTSSCPNITPHLCLPDSLPILKELNTTDVHVCCAACSALSGCLSWTVNPSQKRCHLRATSKPGKKGGCTSGVIPPGPPPPPAPPGAPNVLFLVVDDLRPELHCYGVDVPIKTPNLDKLATSSLVFRNAYNQYSVCSPSRNSFMSGRRPDTTKVWNFIDDFRHTTGQNWVTLPEVFKVNGYNTTGGGKLYHGNKPPKQDEPRSWTTDVPYFPYQQGTGYCNDTAWCELNCPSDSRCYDTRLADHTIKMLRSHVAHGTFPFFVGAGFIRPHVDWAAPKEFYDLYPPSTIKVATNPIFPKTAPRVAWTDGGYLDRKSGDLGPNYVFRPFDPVPDEVAIKWRRGYYAAVSYMDAEVGRVLDELDALGLTNSTVVSFVADHGYQLGAHSMWEKYTNFEDATRVPMMLRVPSKPLSHGVITTALVENVDLYPTLAGIAGLKVENGLEGYDASPLLDNPHRPWKKAAFSQYARCDNTTEKQKGWYTRCSGKKSNEFLAMGYAVRTVDWRYVEWFAWNGTTREADMNHTIGVELYDHRGDIGVDFEAYDNVNVVEDPQNEAIVRHHREVLRAGWRGALPPHSVGAP